jgi:hypothetical protein
MREEEDKCGSDVHCHWTSIVNKVIGTITKKHCVAATMYLYFKIYKSDLCIGGGNRSIKRYETSISYFMSNITLEIYTMFLFMHVAEQMWTVSVVQSTKIHSTIGY